MPTLLADPPAAAPPEQPQPASGSTGGASAPGPAAPAQRSCAKCGSELQGGQDWCLQCGAGSPNSLDTRAPSWRSAAAIIGAVLVLVAGAATAAYAALSKSGGNARAVTTVAQVPAAPPTSVPLTPATPTPTAKIGAPTTIKPIIPTGITPTPKIPVTTPTPTPKIPSVLTPSTSPGASKPQTTGGGGTGGSSEPKQQAIVLDTNAAATYNPYNYPAANFGDPSLAIDGDNSTGWTAQVEPAVAPKMAEGLVIDLNSARKLSAVGVSTSTPGMTVQIYGAAVATLPASITDAAWIPLAPSRIDTKKHLRITLGGATTASKLAAKKAYRYVALWISEAPAASVGTTAAPGHVSVNELELFPLKK